MRTGSELAGSNHTKQLETRLFFNNLNNFSMSEAWELVTVLCRNGFLSVGALCECASVTYGEKPGEITVSIIWEYEDKNDASILTLITQQECWTQDLYPLEISTRSK